ncbi:hypothetical protein ACFS3C_18685 [Azotobacter vinelandii]
MTIGIAVDRLAQAVTNANFYGNPNVELNARILRARAEGDPCRDFAHGTLDAAFVLPEGTFTLRIRWEAEGQSKVEHGWICREAPHLSGGGIFSDAPILDGDSVPLSADADELVGLAYEFFSPARKSSPPSRRYCRFARKGNTRELRSGLGMAGVKGVGGEQTPRCDGQEPSVLPGRHLLQREGQNFGKKIPA